MALPHPPVCWDVVPFSITPSVLEGKCILPACGGRAVLLLRLYKETVENEIIKVRIPVV